MAELVCSAFLSSFLQVAFEKLASPQVLDFFRRTKLDQNLPNKLKAKLRSIDALADDAEQKQFKDLRVRDWLLKVKDVVLDAEDVLDEIQYEQLSKSQVEAESESDSQSQTSTGCTCKVPNFFRSYSVSSFNKEVNSSMKKVLDDLDNLESEMDSLGLRKASEVGVGSGLGSEVSQKSSSVVVESDICGRDDDKRIILDWLTSDTDNKLSILSIVGMGGLGKTTLAQLVYNDSKIEGKFDTKAWVFVSDDFDVLKVTRTILERITGSTDDSRDLEMVHARLKQKLSGKKFLLVLDDVWNEEWHKWEEVQKPLVAFGAQESRILVTTRSNEVASTMRSKVHNLKELQQDHCWQLFSKHAFPGDNLQRSSYYKEIGMKIVEKCKGLPLALKSMGSLLHNKSSVSEWQSVLESEIWQLKDNNIVPALALSYLHLPSHLKTCFAYCALFFKDYVFDKGELIMFWMGEKFLQCLEQSRSPQNVGEQIFNDLLSRSFFQQSSIYNDDRFVIHDLLNDLAKYVCGDICFRLDVDQVKGIPKATRHFSFSTRHTKDFDGFGSLHDVERLRSFMPTHQLFDNERWQCKMWIDDLFSKLKFLRVLSLKRCDNLTEVPQSVGNLKHLCSLDLSETDIEKLPKSTCSLFNLQILKLNYCLYLKELPSNLQRLTNMRRLEFKGSKIRKVPPYLGKLKNLLVCMSWFDVGESREFTIQQLGELNVHGSLKIRQLQNIENPLDALAMDLKNKTHLEELELVWQPRNMTLDDSLKEREDIVMENLKPSKQLKKLSISNYGGTKFPSWLSDNSLWNMVSLKLENCQSCQHLPSLGILPLLKELEIAKLDGIVSIDADFYGSEPFSFTSLETLNFSDMKEWERWECEGVTGAFPRLQHLSIRNCPKLKGDMRISEAYGSLKTFPLDFFPTLNSLTISGLQDLQMISVEHTHNHLKYLGIKKCPELESLPERMDILQELAIEDCPKVEWVRGGYLPSNLKWMTLNNCSKLVISLKGTFCANPSLEFFRVEKLDAESFPYEGLLPLSLTSLVISNCKSLKKLEYKGLCHLSSLEKLYLHDCPELECLPEEEEGLPKSISYLSIAGCPMVKQRCEELTGEDWPKIAHIQDRFIR